MLKPMMVRVLRSYFTNRSLVIILDNIFRINKLKEVGKEDMVQRQKEK